MRVVSDRLSVRWYLDYDLHEPLPEHSSLTRIRERYGLEVFRRFFERIVEECFEAGLVWGEELFLDATKVEANASIDSTRSRSLMEGRLEEHLTATFPGEALPVREEDLSGVVAGVVGPRSDQRRALARRNAPSHRWIANDGRQERGSVRWGYTRMADLRMSTTDAHSSPTHRTAWYHKAHPTFADALALVRKELWAQEERTLYGSPAQTDTVKVPKALVERLTDAVCYAA